MYTADLPDPIRPNSLTIQYADDVTQLGRGTHLDYLTNALQAELTATSLWELKWRITSHPDKTTVTYYNKKRTEPPRRIFLYPFLPNPTPIPQNDKNKVLGVTFDKNRCFAKHITEKVAIANNTLSNLARFRGNSTRTKTHLYKALVRPTLTYCPLAVSLIAKTNHLRLQVVQNKALRLALNTHWTEFKTAQSIHEELNIPPLNIVIHHRVIKQLEKFRLTHTEMYDFINNLPSYYRRLQTVNLLDPDNHEPPDPVYTKDR